jgi:hypothetical protein
MNTEQRGLTEEFWRHDRDYADRVDASDTEGISWLLLAAAFRRARRGCDAEGINVAAQTGVAATTRGVDSVDNREGTNKGVRHGSGSFCCWEMEAAAPYCWTPWRMGLSREEQGQSTRTWER